MADDLSSAIDVLEKSAGPQERQSPRPASLSDAIDQLETSATKEGRGEETQAYPTGPTAALGAIPIIGPTAAGLAQTPLGREFLKGITGTVEQAGVGAMTDVAGLTRAVGGDRLAGKDLAGVQTERDKIEAEQAAIQSRMNTLINSGTRYNPQDLNTLSTANAELEKQKNDATEILKSGQPRAATPLSAAADILGGTARGVARMAPEDIEKLLPTTQALDQSMLGKIASGIGTLAAMAPLSLAGPELEIPAFAMIGSGAQYEDAIHRGADENTAENAALLGGIATLPQSLSMLPFMGLAKKLGGMTPIQAMAEIGKASAFGGAGGAAWQAGQNMVARLSGYDPNRPLDEGVYEQLAFGAGLGALVAGIGTTPGLARYLRGADTEVRERPPTPPFREMPGAAGFVMPEQGPPPVTVPGEARPPGPTLALPGPPGLPTTPAAAEPVAEIAADVRRASAQTPEQLLAEKGAPGSVEQALREGEDLLAQVGAVTPPTPPTTAVPTEVAPAREAPTAETPTRQALAATAASPEAEAQWEAVRQHRRTGGRIYDAPPITSNELPPEIRDLLGRDPGAGARWQAYSPMEKAAYLADVQPAVGYKYAHVPQSNEIPRASIRGEPVERDNPDLQRKPDQAEVKKVTNDAASAMGLDQVVHYISDAGQLPERVKKTLTDSQRSTTAQTVWDHSMRELWVIGDRFDSVADLHRALIEETQGRLWRDVADVHFVHDPNDNRLGYYDIPRDRPVLNTDALMRSSDPFGNAAKTAIEEVAVHKGLSRLYGTRESAAYVDAMNALQRNFDRSKMNDALAQEKGFKDLEDMAKAYRYEDYASNPRHRHALTEELAGAYAQGFRSRDEIDANAPRWYQVALKSLTDGLRRKFGMQLGPLDMQHLLADSMSALRYPKYPQPGRLMPELVGQAKLDMAQHQLAALHGEEGAPEQMDFLKQMGITTPPPPPPVKVEQPIIPEPAARAGSAEEAAMKTQVRAEAGREQTANIGNLFVKQQMRETAAQVQAGQGIRAQPPKLAMQAERALNDRMKFAEPNNSIYQKRGEELDNVEAQHEWNNVYDRDIRATMQGLMQEKNPTPVHAALREIVDREVNKHIDNLWETGLTDEARSLQLARDQWNQKMQERVTGTAQELQAQKRFTDGSQEVGKLRAQMSKQQAQAVKTKDVAKGQRDIGEQVRQAALKMVNRLQHAASAAELRLWQNKMADPMTLADRYIRAVAEGVDASFAKAGFNDADRPLLQQLFNIFQQRITEQIREGTSLPEKAPPAQPPSATEKIRNMISNYDMFQRTWDATVDQLKTENPNAVFFAALERAMGEPIGERGVRAVVGEQNKMGDLIYKHYSTLDRINQSLAQTLTQNLGIEPALAAKMQQHFDDHFRTILSTEQQAALQRILDSVPGKPGGKPAKGEVARLVDLLALGGFNKDEWINLLAPRYNLGTGWTPEIIQGIKDAGDMLQRIRDEGNDSPVVRDRYEAQIADLLARSQTQGNIISKRVESLWMASLLTGPITHLGYAIQNAASKWLTVFSHALETGDMATFAKAHSDAIAGFQRALGTDIPYIMRTGISPVRELHTEGQFPFRSSLESVPIEGRFAYLNRLKYVSRALMALETFSIRGTQYAMQREISTRLAHDMGYDGAKAEAFADQAIYGTQEKIEQARREALADQARWGFDDRTLAVREQEILDRLRSTSDDPDTTIADRETEAMQSALGESTRVGLHAALREDVPGALGVFSRLVQNARAKHTAVSYIMPFNKLPMNLANEWLAWTPLGVWRGRDRLTGGTAAMESYYREVPRFQERVEAGRALEAGARARMGPAQAISERELRSMAYEQFIKGMAGTAAMAALGTYLGMNKDDPDPAFWVTADGPSSAGGKNMAKAEGFSPYTIKLGNFRLSYLDSPLKGVLGILGAAADYMRYEANPDDPGSYFGPALTAGAMHIGSIAFDTGSLQTLTNLGTIFNPGTSEKERQTRLENLVASTVSGFALIPAGGTIVRQAYRLIDPRQFEAHDASSIFIRNIPVLNGMFLQPKLNVFGEPVTNSPLARLPFLPIGETGGTLAEGKFYQTDPVWQYVEHTGLHLSLPGVIKKIDGVAISPAELHLYHEARGRALKEALAEAIQDPDFTSQSIDDQDKQVKSEFEKGADEAGVGAVIDYRDQHPSASGGGGASGRT